jgi:DNA-binding transcriptional LysR family regulator
MMQPPFSQMQAFLAVARARSFSGAARELALSRAAVSQSVRQLENVLRVTLFHRTTRSVSLTDEGQRLVDTAGPAMTQLAAAMSEIAAKPGEAVGRLKLSVPRLAGQLVIEPVLPIFRERYPRVSVEIVVEDRFVDIAAGAFDAGIRLAESIERDMVQVRVTPSFRFLVVGSPAYLKKRGRPQKPEDLLEHECVTFRSSTTGALFAWELERGRKSWRVPVRGGVISNDSSLCGALAAKGMGLAYVAEPRVVDQLRTGELEIVLEAFAPRVPGFFLYFPSRARRSTPMRLFVETAREVLRDV